MQFIIRLYRWLGEPWPLHLLPIFIGIHMVLIHIAPEQKNQINAWASAIFQIFGGVMIIYSINSNLNILSKTSMKNSVVDWLKRCPAIRKPIMINLSSSIQVRTRVPNVELSMTPKLTTIEDKVEHLLSEFKRLEFKIDDIKELFQNDLQNAVTTHHEKHLKMKEDIKNIKKNLNYSIVGDVKLQVLGVLIISYGLILPLS